MVKRTGGIASLQYHHHALTATSPECFIEVVMPLCVPIRVIAQ
jgi:hypothetical protein